MANIYSNTASLQEVLDVLQTKAVWAEPQLQEKTVTPSNETLVVEADANYDGLNTVTVVGDSNLDPDNIKRGVSIFGVDGNLDSAIIEYDGNTRTLTITTS